MLATTRPRGVSLQSAIFARIQPSRRPHSNSARQSNCVWVSGRCHQSDNFPRNVQSMKKNVTNCARFVAESVGRIIRRRKCGSRWLSNERRTRLFVLLCVPHVSPASVASISLRPFWQPQLIRLTCLSTPSSHMWSARANIVTLVRYPTAPFFKKNKKRGRGETLAPSLIL